MKSKEELNQLKSEFESFDEKDCKLSDEELEKTVGGRLSDEAERWYSHYKRVLKERAEACGKARELEDLIKSIKTLHRECELKKLKFSINAMGISTAGMNFSK